MKEQLAVTLRALTLSLPESQLPQALTGQSMGWIVDCWSMDIICESKVGRSPNPSKIRVSNPPFPPRSRNGVLHLRI